jgi:hypothetical protein
MLSTIAHWMALLRPRAPIALARRKIHRNNAIKNFVELVETSDDNGEGRPLGSVFGSVQGTTGLARSKPHQDDQLEGKGVGA